MYMALYIRFIHRGDRENATSSSSSSPYLAIADREHVADKTGQILHEWAMGAPDGAVHGGHLLQSFFPILRGHLVQNLADQLFPRAQGLSLSIRINGRGR